MRVEIQRENLLAPLHGVNVEERLGEDGNKQKG